MIVPLQNSKNETLGTQLHCLCILQGQFSTFLVDNMKTYLVVILSFMHLVGNDVEHFSTHSFAKFCLSSLSSFQ